MEALGINISGLLTQIISFSILVGILYSFLYKPILKMLDNRSNKIKESLSKATEVQAQSEETETAIQAKLAEANKASQDILSKARETASKLHDSELNKLKEELEAERLKAKTEIEKEKNQIMEELKQEFSTLVTHATSRVIGETIDNKHQQTIIDKILHDELLSKEK